MDLSSTGSSISKYNIDDVFIKQDLVTIKDNNEEVETVKEEVEAEQPKVKELTMDDFLDDFKL